MKNQDFLLNQVFEESRYHRQFHHMFFVLAITLYSGLLALQLSKPVVINNESIEIFLVAVVGVIIPLYFSYTLLSYHVTIAKLNSVIFAMTAEQRLSTPTELDALFFQKYGKAVSENKNLLFIGRGHWFFVGIVGSLVALNAFVYFNPISISS